MVTTAHMVNRIDHVGYVVRDLAAAVAALGEPYGLRVANELDVPQFSLRAVFLEGGDATVEAIEFTDSTIAQERLQGMDMRLDHVAFEVDDIERAAKRLRSAGTRFCGPDGREMDAPLEFGGARHLWTVPPSAPGVCLQLIQRS